MLSLERSNYDGARARCEEALALFRRAGYTAGEASCIRGLGGIARGWSEPETARIYYQQALNLYLRITDIYSIGLAHDRLARVASGDERESHVMAAREVWASIGRQDRIDGLDREFGVGGRAEGDSDND